jgi:signal transduction histidine kinase
MKKNPLLWAVQPWQGLLESLLVGLFLLSVAARLEGFVEAFVFQAAVFFLCGVCGLWAVLRIRIPRGGRIRQFAWEAGTALGLSLLLFYGLRGLGSLLHWDSLWRLTGWKDPFVFACTGPGYLAMRGGVRLWLRWDQMRRRRMLWSLTHAHLTVVAFFAFLAALIVFSLVPFSNAAVKVWTQTKDPLASFITGLVVTFFPALTLITVMTIALLAVLLPPLAVFSFFVARRTTRRLETLAAATAALRAGNYQARVTVDGEDEVAHLQSDFNAMAERLSATLTELKTERDAVADVLQSRRDLVANVSHELRTPVATLSAAIETTLDQWEQTPPAETRQNLTLMENEVLRLSGLIDDLFTLSQADVNNLPLVCIPVDLAVLIEQVISTFAPLAWNAGRVEVASDLPVGLPPVQADERRVRQVLLNLLRNAVRHTSPGGIVAIQACREAEKVRIDVRDTGEGIAPEDLPRIWERFYRGKNAAPESAGLGLALVKELVEAMGGSVDAQSQPGLGSCFTISLPLA